MEEYKYNAQAFLDYFEQIYIINLIERTDRKKEVTEQLCSIGLDPQKNPNIKFFEATIPSTAGEFESKGARGCFNSHLSVLKEPQKQKCNRILILEDDVNFTKHFKTKNFVILNSLKNVHWSIFYGDCKYSSDNAYSKTGITKIDPNDHLVTAHFIAFQGDIIDKMISFLELLEGRQAGDPKGGPMHVDGAYSLFRANNAEYDVYFSNHKLAYQRSSKSNITPSVKHKVSDYFNHLLDSIHKSR